MVTSLRAPRGCPVPPAEQADKILGTLLSGEEIQGTLIRGEQRHLRGRFLMYDAALFLW